MHNECLLPSIMLNWDDTINDLTETSTVTITTHIRRQRATHWKLHCTGTVSTTAGTLTRIFYICKPSRLPVGERGGGGGGTTVMIIIPRVHNFISSCVCVWCIYTFSSFPRRICHFYRSPPAQRYSPVMRRLERAGYTIWYTLQWYYLELGTFLLSFSRSVP